MKTFFNILQKCAHSTTVMYPDEPIRFDKFQLNQTHSKPNPKYDFIKACYVYNIVCKIPVLLRLCL